MRAFAILATLAALCACGVSHPPLTRCDPRTPCPGGQGCARGLDGFVCVDRCDQRVTSRCPNGAACYEDLCDPGGTVAEGEVPRDAACTFGLRPTQDWTSDPLLYRCEPSCNESTDCRVGEVCVFERVCAVPCTADSCGSGNSCVNADRRVSSCVNARRLARIDCDGDGDGDCWPGGMCGTGAVMCAALAPGTEL